MIPMNATRLLLAIVALMLGLLSATSAQAQVGKSLGVVDANLVPEADLLKMPNMTPAIVKVILEKRPFNSIVELNKLLLEQGLKQEQANELYTKAFVHVNLNTGTNEEILLIPGAGRRMTIEFPEYRPWVSWAQFDREISKYIGQEATDKLKQYVFIPVKLNTATNEDILSIPGAGQRMVREFNEYRPWTSKAQFDREISKYVGQKETDRLWRFVVIDPVAPAKK
jgi:DNA uptake protein ComE-like DNA-binding protein